MYRKATVTYRQYLSLLLGQKQRQRTATFYAVPSRAK